LDLLKDIKIIQIDSLVRNPSLQNDFRALARLYRIIKCNKYDIVHTHIAKAGFIGRIAAWFAGVPVIIHSLHGITFPPTINPLARYFYIVLEKLAAKFTTHFVSVGEDLKSSYLAKGVGKPGEFSVIRSGMDLDYFRNARNKGHSSHLLSAEMRIDNNDTVIGYVANLEARKGHKYAIEAAEKIVAKYPHTKFLFVGEGDLKDKISKTIRDKGLERNILLTGYRKDIAEVMAIFDIKIFTSLWEGLPQVVVQSVAMGIPIVSFDTDGVRELVRDGYNGYIVPMKDVDALVNMVCSLLGDMDAANQMGLNGRNIVGSEWEISTMVEKISELYKSLYLANVCAASR
jgi:glycosyltransferase involved in cell wall biosynthesis